MKIREAVRLPGRSITTRSFQSAAWLVVIGLLLGCGASQPSLPEPEGSASEGTHAGTDSGSAAGAGAEGEPDAGADDSDAGEGPKTGKDSQASEKPGEVVQVGSVRYLIMDDRAVTLFEYSADAAERYAKALNRFRERTDSAIRVYSMLVPTSAEFVDASGYESMNDSQKEAFAHIDDGLDPAIVRVDAYGALKSRAGEYLFFRTDHHWTAIGAYYAYVQLMDTMGEKPIDYGRFEKGTIEGVLGSDYKATGSAKLKAHPDTLTYCLPLGSYKYYAYTKQDKPLEKKAVDPRYAKLGNGAYAVFLGGDYPWGAIETGTANGRRILVVKDSFGNALIPYLIPHYETIYYIDPRSYGGSLTGFLRDRDIQDVLFLNNSTVARNSSVAESLDRLMESGRE
ncbi:hypothetical protein H7B90_29535 [Cohnella xylanilytica]|uniref:DHHW motif protein n=1 Tax=Cohnella xylanilytica TaxID=557555 RepID=A0A841UCA2_9BACL|nr:hypothetical protein [Cohnella xylanilytica]